MDIEKQNIGSEEEPYFMQNTDWYYFDEEEWLYKPTKEAPQKARESIERYNIEHDTYDTDWESTEF